MIRVILIAAILSGCANHPSRNMQDMTADELRRELSRAIVPSQFYPHAPAAVDP